MSSKKFKTISYCVRGKHQSSTRSIGDDVRKTGQKLITGKCVECNRKKLMNVIDHKIATEGLNELFKFFDGVYAEADKNFSNKGI